MGVILDNQPWLEFIVAGESYAVPVAQVIEILTWRECEPVPGSDGYVRGIINFRGSVIPVVDMSLWLNNRDIEPGDDSKILMMTMAGETIGVAVDAVQELIYPENGQLEAISEGQKGLTDTCFYQDRLIALFDWSLLTGMLSPDEE